MVTDAHDTCTTPSLGGLHCAIVVQILSNEWPMLRYWIALSLLGKSCEPKPPARRTAVGALSNYFYSDLQGD